MAITSHHVRATMGYYQPNADGTPPDVNDLAITLGAKDMDPRDVTITDIRGSEDEYKLEEHGFQVIQHTSSCNLEDFADEKTIKDVYYPEIEELLLKSTGAHKIIIFNHLLRNGPSPLLDSKAHLKSEIPGPAPRVHIDQTPHGASLLLSWALSPSIAASVTSSQRWQIINVWRPLKTIIKDPLAFADSRTVPESDRIALPRVYPGDKPGENCVVKCGDPGEASEHRWYYVSGQRPNEVVLLKQHDSFEGSRTRGTPHASFPLEGTEGEEWRRSVEVRAVVCY